MKQVGKWLPGVIVSAGALFVLFRVAKWEDLVRAFTTASPQFLAVVFILIILSLMVRGKAWQTILGKPVNWIQAFFGVSEGYFLNDIFPLKAGEVGRSIYIGKLSGLGTFRALSSVIIERAFDLAIAAALVLSTLPFVIGAAWVRPVALVALVLVVIALAALFFIARNQTSVSGWLYKVSAKHEFVKKNLVPPLEKLIQGFGMLTRPSQFIMSLFWIAATWVVWISFYYLAILQIAPNAPVWWALFSCSIIALGVALPSAPAGIGLFEAAMVAALTLLGLDSSLALAYAIIVHFAQVIVAVLLGVWGLMREKQSLGSLLSKSAVQSESSIAQE